MCPFCPFILSSDAKSGLTQVALYMFHIFTDPYMLRIYSIITSTLFLFVEQTNFTHDIKQSAHKIIE